MSRILSVLILIIAMMGLPSLVSGQADYEVDKFDTPQGELELWFIGHGTLMFKINDFVIHIDPVTREGDYNILPQADLVLITHPHGDHLDPGALELISGLKTRIICNESSASKISNPEILKNGESVDLLELAGFPIEINAVPAYNIKHERAPGSPFHPKGEGNGYVISLGGKTIYVAGDTEDIPEMAELKNIDIAFLPMNLPYTMSPEMVAEAAKMFKPVILYPYHYGSTDTNEILELLKGSGIEVRIRKL